MRNGFTLNAIAITLLLILNCGCGSNRVELPGSQPGQVPVDDSLTVTSPDGLLTLVFPAGSLPPNTDVTIEESPPAFPFVSKLYTVQPVGLFLNKPARLSLAAEAVSLNQSVSQTVGVRSDEGAVAWLDSTFADATYTVPIYFLSRFGLGESGSVTDEEQARTKFVSSVIPITDEIDEFESGTGGTPFRDSIAGYGPYAMEKGDNVGRATSQYRYNYPPDGNPPELVEIPIDDFVASDDGWFFWLDMADQTLFEHPTLYLFLSKQNGRLTIFRQDETPQLRGEDILFSNEVRLNSDKRIFGPDPQPSDIVAQQSITPLEIQDCKRLALILKATNEGFVQNTVADIRTGLGTIGIPIVERRITNPGDIKTIIDEIVRFQRDECDCEGFDEVFVYLVAHGQDAGSFIYKDENGKTLRPKTSSRGLSTNNRFILGEKEAIQTNFMDFLLDLSRICRKRPDPETQIGESGVLNIFIEACYSGAGLEELIKARDSFKDTAVANSERVKQILCFRANVITACDFDETSKGRYFTSPFNKRQQATAQFVRDLSLIHI